MSNANKLDEVTSRSGCGLSLHRLSTRGGHPGWGGGVHLTALGDGSVGGGLGAHATDGHTAAADQNAATDWKHHEEENAHDDDDDDGSAQARGEVVPA